jgi:hypothetical protein
MHLSGFKCYILERSHDLEIDEFVRILEMKLTLTLTTWAFPLTPTLTQI